MEDKRAHMVEELADIALYCTYFARAIGDELPEAMSRKVDLNAKKYPVEASRGNSKK